MHENRETSESSRLNQSRDRSEKALRHIADRHASEESDCAIVPVNPSNKEEQSSAEMGEGRAQTKENIGPSNTSPTQSGERVSQGRDGVRQVAKERKQERATPRPPRPLATGIIGWPRATFSELPAPGAIPPRNSAEFRRYNRTVEWPELNQNRSRHGRML